LLERVLVPLPDVDGVGVVDVDGVVCVAAAEEEEACAVEEEEEDEDVEDGVYVEDGTTAAVGRSQGVVPEAVEAPPGAIAEEEEVPLPLLTLLVVIGV
jgi:hypothetical protein